MNLYPDHLRKIADLCEALDKVEEHSGVYIESPHRVICEDVYLGDLKDEIGGSYSFLPSITTKEITQ